MLIWNYHDEDVSAPDEKIVVRIDGLPANVTRASLAQYRIDQSHSNAYSAWQQLGSPQSPTPEQYSALAAAGQLQTFESPRWIGTSGGKSEVEIVLPAEAVSLLQIRW